jgi:hypothetical protein
VYNEIITVILYVLLNLREGALYAMDNQHQFSFPLEKSEEGSTYALGYRCVIDFDRMMERRLRR